MSQAAILLLLACAGACGQDAALTFDVASVKHSAPDGGGRRMVSMGGGPGSKDPGRINYQGVSLKMVLVSAYDVKNFQISGPDWLDSEFFDITAKVPQGTTREQSKVMMQNLLAERFHLALHREKKEMPGFELTIAKGGSKLKDSAPEPPPDPAAPPPPPRTGPPKRDANGFPIMDRPGMMMMMQMGPKGPTAHMAAKSQDLAALLQTLGNQLRRPIVDKTGLTGKYDFNLEYSPDLQGMGLGPMPGPGPGRPEGGNGPAPAEESGPDIATALREQLGLKLDSKKLPVDMLIIDKVDRVPVEN